MFGKLFLSVWQLQFIVVTPFFVSTFKMYKTYIISIAYIHNHKNTLVRQGILFLTVKDQYPILNWCIPTYAQSLLNWSSKEIMKEKTFLLHRIVCFEIPENEKIPISLYMHYIKGSLFSALNQLSCYGHY